MKRLKLITVAMVATGTLLITAAASANNLSVNSGTFRVTWARLTFNNTSGIIPPMICPVTLEGSFHRATTTKTRGSLIGYVTRASVSRAGSTTGACEGASVTILTPSLPWHVTYEGFTGSLPRPTGIIILLRRMSLAFNAGGITCLFVTGLEANENFAGVANLNGEGVVTGFTVLSERSIRLTGGFPCELARVQFAGTGTATTSAGSAIRATLI